MRIFKKQEKPEGLRRLPLLPELSAGGLPEYADGSWCADDGGVNYMELIYQNMQVGEVRQGEVHAIPDMLKRSAEFSRRMLSEDPAVFTAPIGEWLGTLAAIALAQEGMVTRLDVNLEEITTEEDCPFFLRALAKNMGEQTPPVTSLSLFMHRTDDIVSEDVPIAFSYPGMPTLLCPAAEISRNIAAHAHQWFDWMAYEDITTEGRPRRYKGVFQNPAAVLSKPEHLDKATALYGGLIALAARYPALTPRIREILSELPSAAGILSGYPLRTDLIPELLGEAEHEPADEVRDMVESWFSDRLCLFHLRRNTREDAPEGIGSFENCHGNHTVLSA